MWDALRGRSLKTHCGVYDQVTWPSKIILVKKRSTWEQLHQKPGAFGNPTGSSLQRMKSSHERHTRTVETVLRVLEKLGVKPWIIEGAETVFKATPRSLVITVGGDGTLLSASHHIGKGPLLLGINSDTVLSQGVLCSAYGINAEKAITDALYGNSRITEVTRMDVKLNGRTVAKRILNEALFSHTCPAAMTRFKLNNDRYACSGVWISTGAGSTGALKSAGGLILERDSKKLQAVVREVFNPRDGSRWHHVGSEFTLLSKTADATLYLDGPFLRVPVGFDQSLTFQVSKEPLRLVR